MAYSGFVKTRRGIVEHVHDGRLNAEELGVYTYMILMADHRNGTWKGSALTLSKRFRMGLRQTKILLNALKAKGYVELHHIRGARGDYPIRICRYFRVSSEKELTYHKVRSDSEPAMAKVSSEKERLSRSKDFQEELPQEGAPKNGAGGEINGKVKTRRGHSEADLERIAENVRRSEALYRSAKRDLRGLPASPRGPHASTGAHDRAVDSSQEMGFPAAACGSH